MKRVLLILALVFGLGQANSLDYNTLGFTYVYPNGVRITFLASDGLLRVYIHAKDLVAAGRVMICEANTMGGSNSIDDFANKFLDALEKNFNWEFGYREIKIGSVTLKCMGTGVR